MLEYFSSGLFKFIQVCTAGLVEYMYNYRIRGGLVNNVIEVTHLG